MQIQAGVNADFQSNLENTVSNFRAAVSVQASVPQCRNLHGKPAVERGSHID